MGVTYIVANSSKRQYFSPDSFGVLENTKWSGILRGISGHALAHLLRPNFTLGFHLQSWVGDEFFLAGDTDSQIKQLTPYQTGTFNEWEVVTTHFDDISLNLLAEMSLRTGLLNEFIEAAHESEIMLINLVNTMTGLNATHIETAVVSRFGTDWRKRYNVALKSCGWRDYPQPMIPEIGSAG